MAVQTYRATTQTRRFMSSMVRPKAVTGESVKSGRGLRSILKKNSGRDASGKKVVRGQGGRHKRYYREIDFRRDKYGITGEVIEFEYDPNRNTNIALVKYPDGEFRYILAPKDMKKGDMVTSGDRTEVKAGNAMKLKNIPIGSFVHNVELVPGKGGQLARSAGTGIQIAAKEGGFGHLKMPSGEVRMIPLEAMATIGMLGNEDYKNVVIGSAGRSRHMGRSPKVRGTAMDPRSHPHGGGEGRSGVGRKRPMTVYGRPAVGKTRNRAKWTNKYIIKRRRAKV